ncbi:MAG TPA: HipA domain-containing protein [Candidatus Baltobacteraceae bacterium]|nr:HipA domain-containing protein [Candidatus Baltobacteraceae bacterium]
MARAAGLSVSDTRLIEGKHGRYFATRRFDRHGGKSRIHMLSAAALLDTDWSEPSMGYDTLIRLTRHVTRNEEAADAMFRRMLFNVLAHNRDDHANQHAFLMFAEGSWKIAPAFDLTFSKGPGAGAGEHYTDVAGRSGDDISRQSFEMVAKDQGVPAARVAEMIEEVGEAVHGFASHASTYDVSAKTLKAVEQDLQRGLSRFTSPSVIKPLL